MKKVYELYQKLEDNDLQNKSNDKKRLDGIYKILYESFIQLNVSQTISQQSLQYSNLDQSEMKEFYDKQMGASIGQEIVKAGYAEIKEYNVYDAIERRMSVLVLK